MTESMLSGGDALFVYTDTTASFTISSESTLGVWLLVVGGGGAGGYSQTTANLKGSYGAGGGGGGGGLIETNGLKLASGTYTITVGAGGPAPTKSGNNGGDGNPSVFAGPTGSGVLFNALGGGGGAASGKAGSDGAPLMMAHKGMSAVRAAQKAAVPAAVAPVAQAARLRAITMLDRAARALSVPLTGLR